MGALRPGRGCGTFALAVYVGAFSVSFVKAQAPTQVPRLPEGGFLHPVAMMGEVNKPGEYQVIPNLTLAQLLDAAGGLTASANGVVVVVHFSTNPPLTAPSRAQLAPLVRPGAAVPPNVSLRRIPLADPAALDSSLRLDPRDVLYVPARNEIYLVVLHRDS